MRQRAIYGTTIVLLHLVVTMVHGTAHGRLHVDLDPAGKLFVLVVIVLAPLVAAALLWTSRQRTGAVILALSMAGSLLFGMYMHFMAAGNDHVWTQGAGWWTAVFAGSAYLLLLTEAVGTWAGVRFVFRRTA
jgi:hypothetical protein